MKITFKKERGQLIPYSDEDERKLKKMEDGVAYVVDIKNFDMRTLKQNAALWKWCEMIACTLNNNNMYISETIKTEVEWNKNSVKVFLFDNIVKALYSKDSSTELLKNEFDMIVDTLINIFSKKGVELPAFPSKELK